MNKSLPDNAPDALYVDADGYVWRDGQAPFTFAMARVNPDNSPLPSPVITYVPEAETRWAEGFAAALHASSIIDAQLRQRLTLIVDEMTESADSELWPYAERLRTTLKRGTA